MVDLIHVQGGVISTSGTVSLGDSLFPAWLVTQQAEYEILRER